MELAERSPAARERAPWRAVAVPSEHGGWGLTLEPVLLGLLLAPSWAGVLIGAAAFGAFLARTPSKLVAVDVRRARWLERTYLAAKFAAVELAVIVLAVVGASVIVGTRWWWIVAFASPLVAVQAWFEIRCHGRRLTPEVCGAVAVSAVAAAIVVAGDGRDGLAAAAWLLLAARSIGAIPFVRSQIMRSRRGITDVRASDTAQVVAVGVGWIAAVADHRALVGSIALTTIVALQGWWSRRDPPPVRTIGMRQMLLGLALVAAVAIGVAA